MKTISILWIAFMVGMMAFTPIPVQAQIPTLDSSFEQPDLPPYVEDTSLTIRDIHERLDADTTRDFSKGQREFAKAMVYVFRKAEADYPAASEIFKEACRLSSPDWSRPHPVYVFFWVTTLEDLTLSRKWLDYITKWCPEFGRIARERIEGTDQLEQIQDQPEPETPQQG